MNERIIVQVVRLIFTWKMDVLIARVIDMFYVSEGKFDGMMMMMVVVMMMVVMMMRMRMMMMMMMMMMMDVG